MTFAASALTSSERHDWRTPLGVIGLVNQFDRLGGGRGHIALDPCAAADSRHWFAVRNLTDAHGRDGLAHDWATTCAVVGGLAFFNPPYGRALPIWICKAVAEAERGAEIIGLVPARTEVQWFPWQSARAICFWRGRMKFEGVELAAGRSRSTSAPFPSALPYWGPRPDVFEDVFRAAGQVVRLR